MELPENHPVHETKTGWFWLDEHGIVHSVSKPDPPKLSPEESEEDLQLFIEIIGNEPVCILIDAKHAKPNTPQERRQAAEVLPKVTKAMAVIIHNPLGRMIVNLFIGLEKPKYPMKVFKAGEEEKAREWLKKHL